jgi:hypothetical protein
VLSGLSDDGLSDDGLSDDGLSDDGSADDDMRRRVRPFETLMVSCAKGI